MCICACGGGHVFTSPLMRTEYLVTHRAYIPVNKIMTSYGVLELRVVKPVAMEMGYKYTCMYLYVHTQARMYAYSCSLYVQVCPTAYTLS